LPRQSAVPVIMLEAGVMQLSFWLAAGFGLDRMTYG
jgi:hypothetical protein